ncbi:MAG: signal recognition particle receptor subunit alpha, partial [Pseudanabaenaceae cyanobacterium]
MFDELAERLEAAWQKLRGSDKISEANIRNTLREVRRALLEADVSLPVAKAFVDRVAEKALGMDVVQGVKPGQQFIKVVYDELVRLMGDTHQPLAIAEPGPTVVLMAGLQGTGKTTAAAKLALHLRKESRSAWLVAADVYRPAAIDQLKTLGQQINVPVFALGTEVSPIEIARQGIAQARQANADVVIVDTAGRLQIDEDMMAELAGIKAAIAPHEVLLV